MIGLGFTVPTYAVGELVIIYYRQVFLPIGIALAMWDVVQNPAYRMLMSYHLDVILGLLLATLIPWSVVMDYWPHGVNEYKAVVLTMW